MKYRARRNKTDYAVSLKSEMGEFRGEIIDVSHEGARLKVTSGQIYPGTNIAIEGHTGEIPATVIWSEGREAGIEFEHPINDATLNAMALRMRHRPTAGKKKARFLMS